MNSFQEQILKLELEMTHLKEFPLQLINALKYGKKFDENQLTVFKKASEITAINNKCIDFLKKHQQCKALRQQTHSWTVGNKQFFTDLMNEFKLDRDLVDKLSGRLDQAEEDKVNHKEEQEDCDDLTYGFNTKNLNELKLFNQTIMQKEESNESIDLLPKSKSSGYQSPVQDEDEEEGNFHNIITFRNNSNIHTPYKY